MAKPPKPDSKPAVTAAAALPFQEPETISMSGFVATFKRQHESMGNRRFAFILGAGASKSSGIKLASEMVTEWVAILHRESADFNRLSEATWATAATLKIPAYDRSDPATSYSALYCRMYEDDPDQGYAYLEGQMANAEPSYGYSVLGRILATTRHRVVITVNFDNLVADSLSIFSKNYPLVCGHESLAQFARVDLRRPLVLKVHRDLLLNPMSGTADLTVLNPRFADAIAKLLQSYTPVVIGYGGNDDSLMQCLESIPPKAIPGGVYWCYRESGPPPPERIRAFVAKQSGKLVPILGFDELFSQLAPVFDFDIPDKFILDRARERADRIVAQAKELKGMIDGASTQPSATPSTSPASPRLTVPPHGVVGLPPPADGSDAASERKSVSAALDETMGRVAGKKRWWQWERDAEAAKDPDKKDAIYREAIQALPESAELMGNYANFLKYERRASDAAEAMYKQAIEADPTDADYLSNYANLLTDKLDEPDAAEAMHKRAIEADPKHANNLGNYARHLFSRGEVQEGLARLKEALALLPTAAPSATDAECWMYAYCCRPSEARTEALVKLKNLVVPKNIRTGGWIFSGVIAQAVKMNHPEADWLPKLAEVLAGRTEVTTLAGWEAWAATL